MLRVRDEQLVRLPKPKKKPGAEAGQIEVAIARLLREVGQRFKADPPPS
jgi:hypothetical protein